MMDREELRHHIDAVAPGEGLTAERLVSLIIGVCWPGGLEDRTDHSARDGCANGIPSGRPDSQCSCSTGRCVLCN